VSCIVSLGSDDVEVSELLPLHPAATSATATMVRRIKGIESFTSAACREIGIEARGAPYTRKEPEEPEVAVAQGYPESVLDEIPVVQSYLPDKQVTFSRNERTVTILKLKVSRVRTSLGGLLLRTNPPRCRRRF
jgi:hypothetical protein